MSSETATEIVKGRKMGGPIELGSPHLSLPPMGGGDGNGDMPMSQLRPLAGGYYAAVGPAAAWNACAAEIRVKEGIEIRVNGPDSAYRTLARQVYWRNYWCNLGHCENAAVPGTSNHGLGWAFDVPDFVGALLDKYGAKYGFRRACSDAPWENWHWHWCGGWSGTDPGPDGHGGGAVSDPYPTLKHGDNGPAVKRAQKHLRRWNLGMVRPKVDGGFGDNTRTAVKDFQVVHHMKVDGVIGAKTWAALRRKDHFLDDERATINRLGLLLEGGVHTDERDAFRRYQEFCAKRAAAIKRSSEKKNDWKGHYRKERYDRLIKASK